MDVMTVDSKQFIGVDNRSFDFCKISFDMETTEVPNISVIVNSCEAATVQQVLPDTGLGIKRLII